MRSVRKACEVVEVSRGCFKPRISNLHAIPSFSLSKYLARPPQPLQVLDLLLSVQKCDVDHISKVHLERGHGRRNFSPKGGVQ